MKAFVNENFLKDFYEEYLRITLFLNNVALGFQLKLLSEISKKMTSEGIILNNSTKQELSRLSEIKLTSVNIGIFQLRKAGILIPGSAKRGLHFFPSWFVPRSKELSISLKIEIYDTQIKVLT